MRFFPGHTDSTTRNAFRVISSISKHILFVTYIILQVVAVHQNRDTRAPVRIAGVEQSRVDRLVQDRRGRPDSSRTKRGKFPRGSRKPRGGFFHLETSQQCVNRR